MANKQQMQLYFAYGANLNKQAMDRRCAGAVYAGRAKLPGHRLTFRGNDRGVGVADVVPKENSEVLGALWWLAPEHIAALDRFEGYPYLYTREKVQVKAEDGTMAEAVVYAMVRGHMELPGYGYANTILQGYRDCGLPETHLLRALAETSKGVQQACRQQKLPVRG